jgi:hypothetical protein
MKRGEILSAVPLRPFRGAVENKSVSASYLAMLTADRIRDADERRRAVKPSGGSPPTR